MQRVDNNLSNISQLLWWIYITVRWREMLGKVSWTIALWKNTQVHNWSSFVKVTSIFNSITGHWQSDDNQTKLQTTYYSLRINNQFEEFPSLYSVFLLRINWGCCSENVQSKVRIYLKSFTLNILQTVKKTDSQPTRLLISDLLD